MFLRSLGQDEDELVLYAKEAAHSGVAKRHSKKTRSNTNMNLPARQTHRESNSKAGDHWRPTNTSM